MLTWLLTNKYVNKHMCIINRSLSLILMWLNVMSIPTTFVKLIQRLNSTKRRNWKINIDLHEELSAMSYHKIFVLWKVKIHLKLNRHGRDRFGICRNILPCHSGMWCMGSKEKKRDKWSIDHKGNFISFHFYSYYSTFTEYVFLLCWA